MQLSKHVRHCKWTEVIGMSSDAWWGNGSYWGLSMFLVPSQITLLMHSTDIELECPGLSRGDRSDALNWGLISFMILRWEGSYKAQSDHLISLFSFELVTWGILQASSLWRASGYKMMVSSSSSSFFAADNYKMMKLAFFFLVYSILTCDLAFSSFYVL